MSKLPRPRYFDYSATTPVDPRVLEVMLPFFTEAFGNAESAGHLYGWEAKSAVEKARAQVASLVGAKTDDIIFTSGSTESLSLAILGFLESTAPRSHVITSAAEHKATLAACRKAEKLGHEVTILAVDSFGRVSADQVMSAFRPNTVLVSLMHANNEVGTLNPIAEIGARLKDHSPSIVFHVDAAQTAGRHPLNVENLKIDMLSVSGHKFYAPKGIGALYVRRSDISLGAQMPGGGQERGLRGGTHNVPGIVGLGMAAEIAREELPAEFARMTGFRDQIIRELVSPEAGVSLNGHPVDRLANNVHLKFENLGADDLLGGLYDIAFSTASACSSSGSSHVLTAMGKADGQSATARFSCGRFTSQDDVNHLISRVKGLIEKANPLKSKPFGPLESAPVLS